MNRGTINLGVAGQPDTSGTGLVGMMLDAPAPSAVIRNDTSGVININANDSYAFAITGQARGRGRIVNLGRITIADGVTGSGPIQPGDEGYVSHVDTAPAAQDQGPVRSAVRQYTVGTNANGTAADQGFRHDKRTAAGVPDQASRIMQQAARARTLT